MKTYCYGCYLLVRQITPTNTLFIIDNNQKQLEFFRNVFKRKCKLKIT